MVHIKPANKAKGIKSYFKLGKTFNNVLQSKFAQLGYLVGLYPSYFIMVPLFLTALGITGIQQISYISDPEYLFSPENGKGKLDRDRIEELFPVNSSDLFDSSRNTRISNAIRVFAFAKDNGSMLRKEEWEELNYVDEVIKNITIQWDGKTLTYNDFCAKKNNKCLKNQILNLNDIIDEFINGSTVINYPVMLYPFVLPYFYGGPEVDEEAGHLKGAKSVSLLYFSQQGSKEDEEIGRKWEWEVLKKMLNMEFDYLKLSVFGTRSLEDELERNAASMVPYIYVNAVIMIIFSIITVAAIDWVRSKFYLGIIAVLSSIFGTGAGFGFLMYAQVPFIGINMAIPFLLLGIGLDDQFVVLSAWHRTDPKKSIPERMAESYTEAASSITITSLTTMLSSFVGTMTPFPSVYYFCLYTGVCVFIQYTWFVCFYGGCLVIAGYAEQSQRHAFTCRPVLPLSMSDNESGCYRMFCSGGISKEDPLNDKDNKNQMIMVFFRDYLAKLMNMDIVKIIVLFVFTGYIFGAIYGIMNLKEGLDRRKMVLDDSYLIDFFDKEDEYYRRLPYRVQVIIDEPLNYTDPEVKENVLKMHDEFETMHDYTGDTFYTTSWIRHYWRWIDRKRKFKAQITDDKSMIQILEKEYFRRRKTSKLDVSYNEDKTVIKAIRFIIQTQWVNSTEQDKDMMAKMRELAAKQPYNTLVFHQFFVFFEQYMLVRQTAIQAICGAAIVMMIVALLFIPSARSAFAIAFSIVSIEIGVIGYMSLWNVNLDSVSLICLIMCIGFSVDFSAHISYAFITVEADSTQERVRQCLYSLGLPVLQGGASTIMAVAVLSGVPSYIFKIFFKIVFLVIFFGVCHALFLLPVILSLLVGDSCRPTKNKEHNLAQNLQLPKNIQNDLKDTEIRPSSKSENFSDRSTLRAESDSESLGSSRIGSEEGGIRNNAFETDASEKL